MSLFAPPRPPFPLRGENPFMSFWENRQGYGLNFGGIGARVLDGKFFKYGIGCHQITLDYINRYISQ